MLQELIKSFFLIFMAEMGDKTQILALAFATQFKVQKVLVGVFIGVLLNHSLAIVLGVYLSKLISLNVIQIIAGFSFVIFSLWTLKMEEDEEEESATKKLGPIVTVAVAFFLGELGDKTQLTAITLSIDSSFPLFVLMGTVTGMVLTSGVGIFVGSKLGKRVPELTVKVIASFIFLIFGIQKLFSSLDRQYINSISLLIFFLIISIGYYVLLNRALQIRKEGRLSSLQKKANRLYYLNESIKEICLGEDICKSCEGKHCSVGYSKLLLKNEIEKRNHKCEGFKNSPLGLNKNYDKDRIIESLGAAINYIMTLSKEEEEKTNVHEIRKRLEEMLFKENTVYPGDINQYLQLLEEKDKDIAKEIAKRVKKIDNAHIKKI